MSAWIGDVARIIQHHSWLAPIAVFLGGATTALNPCVLAMIPLLVGFIAGNRDAGNTKRALFYSLFFVLGLAVTFTVLGLVSALLGRMFGDIGGFWKYIVAAVCLVMGLQMLGLWKWGFAAAPGARLNRKGVLGAFLLGLLFGVVSTPCAVPILAVLLALVADKGNVLYGGFLLFVYALGHSILVLVAGTSMGAAKALLESQGVRKAQAVVQKAGGILIIGLGIYFLFRS